MQFSDYYVINFTMRECSFNIPFFHRFLFVFTLVIFSLSSSLFLWGTGPISTLPCVFFSYFNCAWVCVHTLQIYSISLYEKREIRRKKLTVPEDTTWNHLNEILPLEISFVRIFFFLSHFDLINWGKNVKNFNTKSIYIGEQIVLRLCIESLAWIPVYFTELRVYNVYTSKGENICLFSFLLSNE